MFSLSNNLLSSANAQSMQFNDNPYGQAAPDNTQVNLNEAIKSLVVETT